LRGKSLKIPFPLISYTLILVLDAKGLQKSTLFFQGNNG